MKSTQALPRPPRMLYRSLSPYQVHKRAISRTSGYRSQHTAYVTLTGTGLAIGLAVCLPVLLLSTQSLRVSAIATFCLLSVILGVLASMLACGWKIGMIEALCLVIVSGLAVDPVLHVASAFNQAQRAKVQINPIRCAEEAVRRMGPPMLASAITTLASAISLSTVN